MSQSEQADIERSEHAGEAGQPIEEERAGVADDTGGDQDAEPPTPDGEEPDTTQLDPDQGAGSDTEKDLIASDVGIDGAGASAEEAAVRVVEDDLP